MGICKTCIPSHVPESTYKLSFDYQYVVLLKYTSYRVYIYIYISMRKSRKKMTEFHMPDQVHFRKAVLGDVPKIKKLVYDCFIEQPTAYYKKYIVQNLIPQAVLVATSSVLTLWLSSSSQLINQSTPIKTYITAALIYGLMHFIVYKIVFHSFSSTIKQELKVPSTSRVWIGEVASNTAGGEKEIVATGAYGFQNNISPFLRKVIKQQNWNVPCAEIQRVVVDKRYRGKGLGQKMMNILCEEIRKCDDKAKILLWTNNLQTSAASLYSKMRFETFVEKDTHWPPKLASILPFKVRAVCLS